jgi:hypothetical protein
LVTCERCHRKFANYAALKQHYGNQHANVKWPDALEEKLNAEKGVDAYKANLHPARPSHTKLIVAVVLIVIVVGAGGIFLPGMFQPSSSSNSQCASFPFEPIEGKALAVHYHVLVSIFVNGQEVKLPVGIGQGDSGPCTQPLHIHAEDPTTSIIHVESPDARSFTLGDLFKVWAATPGVGGPSPVVFDQNQLFNNRVGSGYELHVFVNGQESSAYGSLVLQSHMVIVIAYGATGTDWSVYQNQSGQPWPYPDL